MSLLSVVCTVKVVKCTLGIIICSAQLELENVPQMHLRQGEETFVKSFFFFFLFPSKKGSIAPDKRGYPHNIFLISP